MARIEINNIERVVFNGYIFETGDVIEINTSYGSFCGRFAGIDHKTEVCGVVLAIMIKLDCSNKYCSHLKYITLNDEVKSIKKFDTKNT